MTLTHHETHLKSSVPRTPERGIVRKRSLPFLNLSPGKLKKVMTKIRDKVSNHDGRLLQSTQLSQALHTDPDGQRQLEPSPYFRGLSQELVRRSYGVKTSGVSRNAHIGSPTKSPPRPNLARSVTSELSIFESDSDAESGSHPLVKASRRFLKMTGKVSRNTQ